MEEYDQNLLWSARYYNCLNEMEGTVTEGKGTRIKRNREGLLLSKELLLSELKSPVLSKRLLSTIERAREAIPPPPPKLIYVSSVLCIMRRFSCATGVGVY